MVEFCSVWQELMLSVSWGPHSEQLMPYTWETVCIVAKQPETPYPWQIPTHTQRHEKGI